MRRQHSVEVVSRAGRPKGQRSAGSAFGALARGAFLAAGLVLATPGAAQEAYVTQANSGTTPPLATQTEQPTNSHANNDEIERRVVGQSFGIAPGANVARTHIFGNDNIVTQFQHGRDNQSDVGIFGSDENYVGVWQIGDGLRSTVGLVNMERTGVLVFQRPGSEPSNVWAFGLRNGGTLIAR